MTFMNFHVEIGCGGTLYLKIEHGGLPGPLPGFNSRNKLEVINGILNRSSWHHVCITIGMLEEPYDPRRHPVPSVKQAMNLYRGCLDQGELWSLDCNKSQMDVCSEGTREEAGLGPMKQILDKIGGWPIVNRQWSENSYVWESAYVYLRSRLGLNYIISMYVDIDSKDTSRRIIYVRKP